LEIQAINFNVRGYKSEAEKDRRGQICERPPHLTLARDVDLGSRNDTFHHWESNIEDGLGVYADLLDVRG
jgi:hypothetical protein